MSDNDVSMQLTSSSPSPQYNSTDNSLDEMNVNTRLSSLCALDDRITEILERGSAIASAISIGKLPNDVQTKKNVFKNAVEEYNQLVEEVNGKLRKEVKLLHEASRGQLLPLNIPVKAAAFGSEKEDMIYESLKITAKE